MAGGVAGGGGGRITQKGGERGIEMGGESNAHEKYKFFLCILSLEKKTKRKTSSFKNQKHFFNLIEKGGERGESNAHRKLFLLYILSLKKIMNK